MAEGSAWFKAKGGAGEDGREKGSAAAVGKFRVPADLAYRNPQQTLWRDVLRQHHGNLLPVLF